MSFLGNKIFLIALTFIVFLGAKLLQRRTGIALLNPILVSIIVLILFLTGFGIDYDAYLAGGFNETASGSRRTFWTPDKKMEPQDGSIHLHGEKWYLHY